MNNYVDKIVAIKENEKKLLEFVKNKITDENNIFNLNTRNIVDVLTHDEKMVKKYEAVVKAQELIAEYTERIKNSNNVDEIVELRKELNKCINKVKKEMINRGFDDIEINNYCEDIKKYRKTISENLRYLKREEKIKEIEDLNNNFDNLNEEELLRLKKLVKNEMSYGKRNINKYLNPEIKNTIVKETNVVKEEKRDFKEELEKIFPPKENIEKKSTLKEELEKLFPKKETPKTGCKYIKDDLEKLFPSKENDEEKSTLKEELEKTQPKVGSKYIKDLMDEEDNKETKESKIEKKEKMNKLLSSLPSTGTLTIKTYDSLHDFLNSQVNNFEDRYRIKKHEVYTKNPIKNIVIFTKNIPIIANNKNKVKLMVRDYNLFFKRSELIGYCEYTRKNNSLLSNMKKIISGNSLKEKEAYYASEHENCINWIIEFCKNNNLAIKYEKASR